MPSSSTFDAQCYINRYPDLRLNKYIMYDKNGLFGFGNTTNDAFSSLMGVQQAAGVKTALVTGWQSVYEMPKDAYKHFQERGKAEGRMGGCDLAGTVYENTFNGAAYIARYPDVRENPKFYIDPVSHYQNKGILQSRIPGYEILNEQTPDGITSPGTTKFISNPYAAKAQADNEAQALHPEDNTIVTKQATTTDTTTKDAGPPLTSVSIGTMNPTIIAGIGLLIIILISKNKKKGKQKK